MKNKRLFSDILLIILFFLSFQSCRHDPVLSDEIPEICFEQQVLPIMLNSCGISGCHDRAGASEGFVAADYESVMEIVTPGDVYGSKLYRVITDIYGENFMPPDNPLTQEQRTIIHLWIAQGARNTTCDTSLNPGGNNGSTDTVTFVQDILPLLQSSCGTTGCHDDLTREEGFSFTSYTSTINSRTVVPFKPNQSEMVEVITETGGEDKMPPPPLPSLSQEKINLIKKWISDGALNSNYIDPSCDTSGNISFAAQVWPVIQTNCLGCHNNSLMNGNVSLDGYEKVKAQAATMRNGISLLKGVINHTAGFTAMPPVWKMADCDIRKIELWIDQGMQNN